MEKVRTAFEKILKNLGNKKNTQYCVPSII